MPELRVEELQLRITVDAKKVNDAFKVQSSLLRQQTKDIKGLNSSSKAYNKGLNDILKSTRELVKNSSFSQLRSQFNRLVNETQRAVKGTEEYVRRSEQLKIVAARYAELGGNVKRASNLIGQQNAEVEKGAKGWGKISTNIKVALAALVAFAVRRGLGILKDLSQLAAKTEDVKEGFERLTEPGFLGELRKSVRGTLPDLDLMRTSVLAINLGVDKSKLPLFLEFASRTARETGQNIEFLTNSIVTGIGRESVKIIDNLGISATVIKEEMKLTGDFTEAVANIIERRMPGLREQTQGFADNWARISTLIENGRVALGRLVNSPIGSWLLEQAENALTMGNAFLEVLNDGTDALENYESDVRESVGSFTEFIDFLLIQYSRLSGAYKKQRAEGAAFRAYIKALFTSLIPAIKDVFRGFSIVDLLLGRNVEETGRRVVDTFDLIGTVAADRAKDAYDKELKRNGFVEPTVFAMKLAADRAGGEAAKGGKEAGKKFTDGLSTSAGDSAKIKEASAKAAKKFTDEFKKTIDKEDLRLFLELFDDTEAAANDAEAAENRVRAFKEKLQAELDKEFADLDASADAEALASFNADPDRSDPQLVEEERAAAAYLERQKELKERQKEINAEMKKGQEIGAQFGEVLQNVFESGLKGQDAANAVIKGFGDIILDLVEKQLILLATSAFAQPDAVASFGATGVARVAVISGLITASVKALRGLITNFAGGGVADILGDGVIDRRPNVPTDRYGDNILAKVKRREMILNETQQGVIQAIAGKNVFIRAGVPGAERVAKTTIRNMTAPANFALGGIAGVTAAPNTGSTSSDQTLLIAALFQLSSEQRRNRAINERLLERLDKGIKADISYDEFLSAQELDGIVNG